MSIIIPYDEKLEKRVGAFVNPSGNMLYVGREGHEQMAKDFCIGQNNDFILECSNREQIDEYISSNLTKNQLQLLKLWLLNYKVTRNNSYSDFLVYLLYFDKIEKIMQKSITTASLQPHVRFYNYYLMDWDIHEVAPIKYNYDTKTFEQLSLLKSGIITYKDDEAAEEIEQIRSQVRLKDRPLFFK